MSLTKSRYEKERKKNSQDVVDNLKVMQYCRCVKKEKEQLKKAMAYIRVSTQDQDLGPEAQRRDIELWCQSQGYQIVKFFEDRLSGATLPEDSPGLLGAFESCKFHKVNVIIVAKRDRLARDKVRFG